MGISISGVGFRVEGLGLEDVATGLEDEDVEFMLQDFRITVRVFSLGSVVKWGRHGLHVNCLETTSLLTYLPRRANSHYNSGRRQ